MSITTYEGLIYEGQIRLKGNPSLPEGARLIVLVAELPVWVTRDLSEAEWRAPFEAFRRTVELAEPAPLENEPLSDEEINASIHAHRRESHAQSSD